MNMIKVEIERRCWLVACLALEAQQAGVVAAGGKALVPSGQLVLKLLSALLLAQHEERNQRSLLKKVAAEKCWLVVHTTCERRESWEKTPTCKEMLSP